MRLLGHWEIMTGRRRGIRTSVAVLFLGVCVAAHGADLKVRAGGLDLTMPAPDNFQDSGEKFRTTLFELMVPSANRLVAAFAPAAEIAKMDAGNSSGGLDAYAIVEAPRQMEYADCTPEVFEQVLKSVGAPAAELAGKQATEEMNFRLKTLGQRSVDIGSPENLGGIFQKTDAYGYASLTKYSQGDRSVTMATASAVIRVRQRLIFAYIFRRYESPETVMSMAKSLEAWTDSILAKNR